MGDMHDDVKRRLEDAGRTLLMLPMPKDGMPAGNRAAWPDVMQRFWDVVGVADKGSVQERMEALAQAHNRIQLHASREAITRLDEVLGWLLKIEHPHHRRTLAARMLVHPISERPLHSWTDIADTMGTNRRTARRWFDEGVQDILDRLAEAA